MVTNWKEHNFEVLANPLPEACSMCPFYNYAINVDKGFCYITGIEIDADGPQDEGRAEDCPIREKPLGYWITDQAGEVDGLPYLVSRCSNCGEPVDYGYGSDFCPFCGADMRNELEEK